MSKPPQIGPDEKAAIALALGRARKRRHPDVVTLTIPPKYACTIWMEQIEFGLAKHLTVVVPPQKKTAEAEAVVDIAHAFGFKRDQVLSQWVDMDGVYHVLGTDHDFHA